VPKGIPAKMGIIHGVVGWVVLFAACVSFGLRSDLVTRVKLTMRTTIDRLERALHLVLPCVTDWIYKNGKMIEYRDIVVHSLLGSRPSVLTLLHAFTIYPVLNRLRSCSEGYTDSDTDEGQTALTWGKMVVSLKDDGETGKESVECAVEDRNVDREEQDDGFRYEKYYDSKRLDNSFWGGLLTNRMGD
jgi:hypothetical protein